MAKALLIKTDGTIKETEVNGLEDLQKAVGGYIEGLGLSKDHVAYVNEDGKILGLPMNPLATLLLPIGADDYIVGDMVIIGGYDDDDKIKDVEPRSMALFDRLRKRVGFGT